MNRLHLRRRHRTSYPLEVDGDWSVLELIPDPAIAMAQDRTIRAVNEKAAACIGSRDIVGRPIEDLLPGLPADPDKAVVVCPSRGPDHRLEVTANPVRTREGSFVVLMFHDVTDRIHQEESRKAAEERYRILSELTSDFAYSFAVHEDGSASVEWVTDAFTRITGYTLDEWRRLGAWRRLVHPDDLLTFEQRLPKLMRGESVLSEARIITKSGDVRWLSVVSRPVYDVELGRIVRVVGAAQDFTARKEAEEARTMFLATASHELKTPLTVIQGFSELLNDVEQPNDMTREALGAIERRADQLNRIVDRILLSSRIETGRVRIALEPSDLTPMIRERVRMTAAARSRPIHLEGAWLPAALVDTEAATTVLDHLLDNAIKYSPDGGPIAVEIGTSGAMVRIGVRDQGIGMTPEQLARCTEKFWQAESTDVRRFGGTGIGLFIVRSLVEAMGGELRIDSKPNQGSTFAVYYRQPGAEHEAAVAQPKVGVGERDSIREFMRQLGVPEGEVR